MTGPISATPRPLFHTASLYNLLAIQNTRENHMCLLSLSHLELLHMIHSYPHLSRPQAEDASFPYVLASAMTFVYLYLSSMRTAMCARTNLSQTSILTLIWALRDISWDKVVAMRFIKPLKHYMSSWVKFTLLSLTLKTTQISQPLFPVNLISITSFHFYTPAKYNYLPINHVFHPWNSVILISSLVWLCSLPPFFL